MAFNSFSTALLAAALLSSSAVSAKHPAPRASASVAPAHAATVMTKGMQQSLTPEEALQKLKEGNERFTTAKCLPHNHLEEARQTASGQFPYAVILSCVDSRVSAEIIFDQKLGDVFNTRVAGNVVNTDVLGSLEFATQVAGAKLVVVLGHSSCGAVKGACDHVQLGNLSHLLEEIHPAVEKVNALPGEHNSQNAAYVEAAATENIRLAVEAIQEKSPLLRTLEAKGQIKIVGAKYDLQTAKVDFQL